MFPIYIGRGDRLPSKLYAAHVAGRERQEPQRRLQCDVVLPSASGIMCGLDGVPNRRIDRLRRLMMR